MNFLEFARAHGLRVNSVTPGKWMAVPTDDHPNKRNGRYKFLGDIGWVQNWATMVKPEMWRGQEGVLPYSRRPIVEDRSAELAAKKAGWILHQCVQATHPYLEKKGFKITGNVWNDLLVIPMRAGSNLVGCQLIDNEGTKKFLKGQRTKGASFVIDAKGLPIFCEGYATGLSIREAMQAMKIRYRIFVCFSAGNLENVARGVDGGIVVADHDLNGVGEDAARRAKKPYWVSDTPNEDFNDFHLRTGLFQSMLSLKRVLTAHKIAS